MKLNTKARPIERRKKPHDWEAYRIAAHWLLDNDPIDVIDRQPEGTENIIREFDTVCFTVITTLEDGHLVLHLLLVSRWEDRKQRRKE